MTIFDDFYFLPYGSGSNYGFSPNIAILRVAPVGHHYGYWSTHTRDASCQVLCFVHNLNDWAPYHLYYKGSVGTENCSSEGSVMRLVKHLHQHKYHTLCFDNWFTTFLLMLKLKALGIIALGTIRSNRIQFVRWTRKKNWRNLGMVHLLTSTINPLLLFTQDWNNSTMWGLW